jgi:hypothetical protein
MNTPEPMNLAFSAIYVLGFLVLLVTEVIGVKRKAKNDTITENWRWVDGHLHGFQQWGWRILTAGLLSWILIHLPGKDGW